MRPPTQANAPQIAIGPTGNGVVVWQEPEIEGIARIWARRIFGTSLDYVLPASATTYDGQPITDDADAPAVAFSRLGQAEVAYRQAAGPSSPMPGPRIFLNILPDGESANGAQFQGAAVVDESVAGGKGASVGTPSIDIDEQQGMRLLYDSNGTPRVIEGNDRGLAGAISLGPPFSGAEPFAVSVMNPQGGGVSAWPSVEAHGHPAVAVREDFPSGAVQTALVSGGAGGEVDELAVGRSGLGDGLVAFRQGQFGNAAIVAAQATAPPAPFVLTAPKTWVKPSQVTVSWLPAPSADGPLTYQLVLDGHVKSTPAGVLQARLDPRGLSSGRHRLQVLATDMDGQSTLTAPATLLIDGVPPSVRIVTVDGGSAVRVRVLDPFSGVARKSTVVSFGDGASARAARRFPPPLRPARCLPRHGACVRQAGQRGRGQPVGERAMSGRRPSRRLGPVAAPGLLAAVLACLAATLVPARAGADVFGPISLVSAGALGGSEPQQAEYAHDAAVSGNGMYVAFDGSVAGVTGVWRRDLATDTLEQVAGGDAEMPSISERRPVRELHDQRRRRAWPPSPTAGPTWLRNGKR